MVFLKAASAVHFSIGAANFLDTAFAPFMARPPAPKFHPSSSTAPDNRPYVIAIACFWSSVRSVLSIMSAYMPPCSLWLNAAHIVAAFVAAYAPLAIFLARIMRLPAAIEAAVNEVTGPPGDANNPLIKPSPTANGISIKNPGAMLLMPAPILYADHIPVSSGSVTWD